MTTIKAALTESTKLLQNHVEQPYNEAIYLMMICLNKKIEWVTLNDSAVLNAEELKSYNQLVNRRLNGEPLAYIRGTQEFWKHEFIVNSSTLIPRPDSETLIAAILNYKTIKAPKILDLGTGSGCLLLSLLAEIPNATGVGVDISNEAIKIASINATNLKLEDRVIFKNISWDNLLAEQYDIIISNPPYIKKEDLADLQKELSFEPITALVSGEDGLECYRSILTKLPSISHENSLIAFEFGQNQEQELLPLISSKYEIIALEKDLAGIPRIIIFKPQK
jgi:release factor glutamine methyltransferase